MSEVVHLDDDDYLVARREPTGEVWLEVCGGDLIVLREVQQRRLLQVLAGLRPGEDEELRALRDASAKGTGDGLIGLPREALLASINYLAERLLGPADG
jgi:hypothetical protein